MDEEHIFLHAVSLDSHEGRTAYLDQACQGNTQLRANVESLLQHHATAGDFLEAPPVELQQTFVSWLEETVSQRKQDRTLDCLTPSNKPDCLGKLGTYEVLEVLGSGGMGLVVRARDTKLERIVAIKLMNEFSASRSTGMKRFLREARAVAAVKHDHVVTIHSVQDEEPIPYLVMEYVDGVSLDRLLERGKPLPASEVVRLGLQIAAGLGAAHQRGLVHRDIKPANLLVESATQRIKITDFGLVHVLGDGQLTQAGELAGTPQFMSPEQACGGEVDPRSDLFCLGMVLYLLCTGRPPFVASSPVATLRAICDDEPLAIRELNRDIPDWLEAIVHRLLQKDPARRPQTASEVEQLLAAERIGPQPNPQPTLVKPRQYRKVVLSLLAVGVLACAGVLLIVTQKGKTTQMEVPDGARIRVTGDGTVVVDLPPGQTEKAALAVAALPAAVREVAAQLIKVNPGFDGQIQHTLVGDEVVELRLSTDRVRDLSPLRSLTGLQRLFCSGSSLKSGQLADLRPLQGLKLQVLDCSNTQVASLEPLKGMPLRHLFCAFTNVSDLQPLAGGTLTMLHIQGTAVTDLAPLEKHPLIDLNIGNTRITDLSPLQNSKLVALYCDGTRIADLTLLQGMPLRILNWRNHDHTNPTYQRIVKSIKTLEIIDGLPSAQFWATLEGK